MTCLAFVNILNHLSEALLWFVGYLDCLAIAKASYHFRFFTFLLSHKMVTTEVCL